MTLIAFAEDVLYLFISLLIVEHFRAWVRLRYPFLWPSENPETQRPPVPPTLLRDLRHRVDDMRLAEDLLRRYNELFHRQEELADRERRLLLRYERQVEEVLAVVQDGLLIPSIWMASSASLPTCAFAITSRFLPAGIFHRLFRLESAPCLPISITTRSNVALSVMIHLLAERAVPTLPKLALNNLDSPLLNTAIDVLLLISPLIPL
ncbi:hypothetical protein BJY04DRAFT_38775 [Aspergillus karnatakaensis]|uniref:uncharacterized protein n=1 Tax=Aspergillus karnatakaensis TaxID=1810916 RepID=UPI003CCD998F